MQRFDPDINFIICYLNKAWMLLFDKHNFYDV